MKIINLNSSQLNKICSRNTCFKKGIQQRVAKIIEDVRLNGDEAVLKYTRKFDKVKLKTRELQVTPAQINSAYQSISRDFVSNLKTIISNVDKFHRRQIRRSWKLKQENGVILGENYIPLESVGIYIPAGTAPLVSSVYMSVLPAKIAGVKKIFIATPPSFSGDINPHILVVANLLKVNAIFKVGGAQAIAGLTFGTKTLPRVDKIIGPGNIFVTEAKRQVFGYVDIDMLAGPTELVIIANKYSNPLFVKADLLAQAEHFQGLAILITTSKSLAKTMMHDIENGFIIVVNNLFEAVEVSNMIAPEHLEIMVNNPARLTKFVKNAGAIFQGQYSPVAVGDYVAGPSHVLPTLGTARFFSGLGVHDFMKATHVISYSKKALEEIREPLEKMANIEGLGRHLDSIKVRLK